MVLDSENAICARPCIVLYLSTESGTARQVFEWGPLAPLSARSLWVDNVS